LIENISKRNINTTLIDIREETMTDIEEWTDTSEKDNQENLKTLNQVSLERHVIDFENNALRTTFANDTSIQIVSKNSLIQNIFNVFDQQINENSQYESVEEWAGFDD
jgi:hypothetical protein